MIGSYSVDKGDAWEQIDQVNKAGTPLIGIDANNKYHIVKTNNQGNLIAGADYMPDNGAYIISNPLNFVSPGGPITNNTFLGSGIVSVDIVKGVYSVNPTVLYNASLVGGSFTFILYKDSTALSAYISTLPPFNAFAPTMADFSDGLAGVWDSVPVVLLGGSIAHTTGVNNAKTIFCDTGTYGLAVIGKSGLNINAGTNLFGVYEFTRVG